MSSASLFKRGRIVGAGIVLFTSLVVSDALSSPPSSAALTDQEVESLLVGGFSSDEIVNEIRTKGYKGPVDARHNGSANKLNAL